MITGLARDGAAVFDEVASNAGLRACVAQRGGSFYERVTPGGAEEFAAWYEQHLGAGDRNPGG